MNNIRLLEEGDLADFFVYLDRHLSQNGKHGSPLFQPLSREVSGFSQEKQNSFSKGLKIPIGTLYWRRAWALLDSDAQIIGHVDLRGLPTSYSEHRALLGMGLIQEQQGKGMGEKLVTFAIDWLKANDGFEYLDLSVLSNNIPAIKLYEKVGFKVVGEIPDRFRIDGNSETEIMMFKCLAQNYLY